LPEFLTGYRATALRPAEIVTAIHVPRRQGARGRFVKLGARRYLVISIAMAAAVMAFDGRLGATLLQQSVLERLGVSHVDEILHRIYVQPFTRAEVASLAPLVIDAAQAGDKQAQTLILQAVKDLADCVKAVADRLQMASPEICTVGGLLNAGAVFTEPLWAAVHRRLPNARVTLPEMPPVMGAALLALSQSNVPLSPQVIANMQAEASRLEAAH